MIRTNFCGNWHCGSKDEIENVKSLQTDESADQKSSLKLSDQLSLKKFMHTYSIQKMVKMTKQQIQGSWLLIF
jgi:hypothetical protein